MVMPRSRSISIESSTCSFISRASSPPVDWISRSASVDLPWSIWATMEKLRMWERGVLMARALAGGGLQGQAGGADGRSSAASKWRSFAPPSVLPDISPTGGEIGGGAAAALSAMWTIGETRADGRSPSLWGRCPALRQAQDRGGAKDAAYPIGGTALSGRSRNSR